MTGRRAATAAAPSPRPGALGAVLLLGLLAASAAAVTPSRTYRATPEQLGLKAEAVRFASADSGVTLTGWWIAGVPQGGAVVIAGTGEGNQADMLATAQEFRKRGYTVLTFDYRGFGPAGAGPSDSLSRLVYSSAYVRDMGAALRWARARLGATPRLFAYGRGMGAAVAVAAAARTGVADGVVADGLFQSVDQYLRATGLDRDRRAVDINQENVAEADEPLAAAVQLRVPMLAILCERDSLFPTADNLVAVGQMNPRASTWVVPGARRGEGAQAPDYYERVVRYLKRIQAVPRAG